MATAFRANLHDLDIMAILRLKDKVRLLNTGEKIPSGLDYGWELIKLDHEWVWCLESEGRIKGVLIASNFHGAAFVLRLKVLPEVGNMGVLRLLRRFRSDCIRRGISIFLTLADLSSATGRQLKHFIEKSCNGKDHGAVNLLSGPLPLRGALSHRRS